MVLLHFYQNTALGFRILQFLSRTIISPKELFYCSNIYSLLIVRPNIIDKAVLTIFSSTKGEETVPGELLFSFNILDRLFRSLLYSDEFSGHEFKQKISHSDILHSSSNLVSLDSFEVLFKNTFLRGACFSTALDRR